MFAKITTLFPVGTALRIGTSSSKMVGVKGAKGLSASAGALKGRPVRQPRIADDAALTQGTWPELRSSVEPPNELALTDEVGRHRRGIADRRQVNRPLAAAIGIYLFSLQ